MTSAAAPSGGARILPALEGLRGVAALVVVLRHATNAVAMPDALRITLVEGPLAPLLNAQGAVQLFFVLSGYVLSRSLERSPSIADWPQFWIKRVFRIHPPYVFGLLVAWGVSFLAMGPPDTGLTRWLAIQLGVQLTPAALLAALAFPGPGGGQLPVGWTLTIEMVYSLALPLLVLLARPGRGLGLLTLAAFALAFTPASLGVAPSKLGWYGLHFALGSVTYRERAIFERGLARFPNLGRLALPVLGIGLLCLPTWLGWRLRFSDIFTTGMGRLDIAIIAVGATLLVVAASSSGPFQRALSLRPARFLGRVSYSLYLLHFPLLLFLAPRLVHGETLSRIVILLAVLLPTSLLASAASHRFVELPCIRLGNRLCRAWAARAGRTALESRSA